MSGRVSDQRGNALAGATINAIGPNGSRAATTTAGDGTFSFNLPPGVYSITVSKGGFQSAENDGVVVAGGSVFRINIALTESNLESLQVIGRTTSTATNRTPFNISETAVSTLPPLEINLRQNNNLSDTVGTLPGVYISRTFSATPNTNFVVRGLPLQTRVTINGHPISSGLSGQWNTNYAVANIFQDVEVVKGTGLNGSIAGESAVGTVNLRTRDFSAKNSAGAQIGADSYAGSTYSAFADVNFLNQKASLIVAQARVGYLGPWDNYYGDRAGAIGTIPAGIGQPQAFQGIEQWQGDFSNRYSLEAELAKLRYRFSEQSSVTFEFLGLQGQYQPQGGSYGTYDGQETVNACKTVFNGSATFSPSLAGCTASSLYTAPYTFYNIGNVVNAYTWFPNSYIQNNEPQFDAEFRTSFKNDTILLRPYTHLINRYISGVNENRFPGNGGGGSNPSGWYAVTNSANCQVGFVAPGTTGGPATGAAGPCFPANLTPNYPAYLGSDSTPFVGNTTKTAPVCSAAPPYTCYTTPTGRQNNGAFGYGTPFSQPELDRLNGYTFSYVHPAGNNIYNLSYDYRKDFTQSASTDQTLPAAGCQYVIGAVSGGNVNDAHGVPYQPGCSTTTLTGPLAQYNLLPRSAIGVPPTVSQYSDVALTGTFQLSDDLRVAIGNYFELYKLNAQIEDPAVLTAYAARGNSNAAPVSLVSGTQSYSHYDPHIGLEYRFSPDLTFRLNGGSSITQPYPSLVSGFGSISIPNAAAHNYTVNLPNFNLKPETTVAYDIGFDNRFTNGSVLSMDGYYDLVHNVFLSNTTTIAPVNGVPTFPDTLFLQSQNFNGTLQRAYGLELQLTSNPTVGFGYYISGTLERSYLDQLPLSIYFANTTPGNGNFNNNGQQTFGTPFFKSYVQLFYNGPKGTQVEFGADSEGQDNSTLGPSYTIFDAALRVPVYNSHTHLQISLQNAFNLNTGTLLGRNLANQGNIEPTTYRVGGTLLNSGSTTSLQALPPRTFRFLLDYRL